MHETGYIEYYQLN